MTPVTDGAFSPPAKRQPFTSYRLYRAPQPPLPGGAHRGAFLWTYPVLAPSLGPYLEPFGAGPPLVLQSTVIPVHSLVSPDLETWGEPLTILACKPAGLSLCCCETAHSVIPTINEHRPTSGWSWFSGSLYVQRYRTSGGKLQQLAGEMRG